jgi:hypothetical protein
MIAYVFHHLAKLPDAVPRFLELPLGVPITGLHRLELPLYLKRALLLLGPANLTLQQLLRQLYRLLLQLVDPLPQQPVFLSQTLKIQEFKRHYVLRFCEKESPHITYDALD